MVTPPPGNSTQQTRLPEWRQHYRYSRLNFDFKQASSAIQWDTLQNVTISHDRQWRDCHNPNWSETACHFAKGRNPSKIQTQLELDFHQIPFQDVRTSDKRSPMCIFCSFFKLQKNYQNNPAAVESRLLRLQHNPSVGRSTAAALQLWWQKQSPNPPAGTRPRRRQSRSWWLLVLEAESRETNGKKTMAKIRVSWR